MTAAAICMRCGVFASRITIARAGASWMVTLGECGGLEEQNKVCQCCYSLALGLKPVGIFSISRRSVRCRDCRLRLHASVRNHHTGVRFDREARYRRERLLFGAPS
ncbi:hypothetical protein B0H14DRAFT_2687981 [Mycena olivaceomarginata]|nr:hypothetical protein B0H14DRAFT_2687981 [Mycena olivaceomarginata]